MSAITYTPEYMDSNHLQTEMILSSLLPPHSNNLESYIKATDGSIMYTYKSNEHGKIMTGEVISLRKASNKLTILEISDNIVIDMKRVDILKEFITLDLK